MADPLDILAPNNLGDITENRGVDDLVANYGKGVLEAKRKAEANGPEAQKDRMRTAKAREFGLTKKTVGF